MTDAFAFIGRVLIAAMFVYAGYGKIGGFEGVAGYIASKGLPLAQLLAAGTIALEIVAGMDASLVVDGFSFSGGVARSISIPVTGLFGGGVLCIDASPVLRNCRFTANAVGDATFAGGGGGGFFANSAARLYDCTFSANSAQMGGGLYAYNSNLVIDGGHISGNTLFDGSAVATGSGAHLQGGSLTLVDTSIEDNVF